jgi:hypothetical protein
MQLPKGIDLSRPQKQPLIAIKVEPGDKVMVLVPQSTTEPEIRQISQYLKQWAPETEFLVLVGPESITVIPASPSEDKAPQGQDAKGVPLQGGRPLSPYDSTIG